MTPCFYSAEGCSLLFGVLEDYENLLAGIKVDRGAGGAGIAV
jgi:hypothetical protein